jgi:predicted RecA/RadA family phage recombinase
MSREAYLTKETANTMQYTAGSTGISCGEVITVSKGTNAGVVAVAMQAIEANGTGTAAIEGEFDLTKGATGFNPGDVVLWDPTANATTTLGTTGIYGAGICTKVAANADSFVRTAINKGPKAFYVY